MKCVLTARKTCCHFSMALTGVTYQMNHMVKWMNVGCFLSLFYWMLKYCFPLTGWVFSAQRLEKPHRCGHWNAFISWSSKMSRAQSDILAMIPPPLFTPLLPHCKNRRKKHVFFCGVRFFLQIPGACQGDTGAEHARDANSSRWARVICEVIDGFFPYGRAW